MCGIWGFVMPRPSIIDASRRLRFCEEAAVAGTLRGDDSAGVFIVGAEANTQARVIKTVGTGSDLVASDNYRAAMRLASVDTYRAVIGHNRAATRGEVSYDNAHPFQDGPITLVHNGTLESMHDLPTTKSKSSKKIDVDSHLICHNLASHDVDEVVKKLYGAYALVWHDARTDRISFIRNAQRPLHLMRPADSDTVLFASEAEMLWWLAGRAGFSRTPIYALDPDILCEFHPGDAVPTARRLAPAPRPYYNNWHRWDPSPRGSLPGGQSGSSVGGNVGAGPANPQVAPKKVRKMLRRIGLSPTDRVEFVVDSVRTDRANGSYPARCTAFGTVSYANGKETIIAPAVVYGILHKFAQENDNKDWVVSPMGVGRVRGGGDPDDEYIICRVVGVVDGKETKEVEAYTSIPPSSSALVRGPGGMMVSKAAFLQMTTNGCYKCSMPITSHDADDIVWVNNGANPLCGQCVAETREALKDNAQQSAALN